MTRLRDKKKKERYKLDPEYRAKCLQRAKAFAERMSKDPVYSKIVALRKDICRLRSSKQDRLKHIEILDKKIFVRGVKLSKLERQWRESR